MKTKGGGSLEQNDNEERMRGAFNDGKKMAGEDNYEINEL